jgi:hypothetical protein
MLSGALVGHAEGRLVFVLQKGFCNNKQSPVIVQLPVSVFVCMFMCVCACVCVCARVCRSFWGTAKITAHLLSTSQMQKYLGRFFHTSDTLWMKGQERLSTALCPDNQTWLK